HRADTARRVCFEPRSVCADSHLFYPNVLTATRIPAIPLMNAAKDRPRCPTLEHGPGSSAPRKGTHMTNMLKKTAGATAAAAAAGATALALAPVASASEVGDMPVAKGYTN